MRGYERIYKEDIRGNMKISVKDESSIKTNNNTRINRNKQNSVSINKYNNSTMKKGFYVSCKKGREEKAFREVSGVLHNLLDSSKEYLRYEEIDIEKELKKEIYMLSSSPFKIYFKYSSMLFVSNESDLSSSHLFNLLRMNDISFTLAQRIVPIDAFFKFNENDLCEILKGMKILKGINPDRSYKIMYEERFVSEHMKVRVFDCITSNLKCKVDLSNPHYLVVVQGLKNNIGISVIENEHNNFNFAKK